MLTLNLVRVYIHDGSFCNGSNFVVAEGTFHVLFEVLDGFAEVCGLYEGVRVALLLGTALLIYGNEGKLELEPLVSALKVAVADLGNLDGLDACHLKLAMHEGADFFEEALLGFGEREGINKVGLSYGLLKTILHGLYIFYFAFEPFVHHNLFSYIIYVNTAFVMERKANQKNGNDQKV